MRGLRPMSTQLRFVICLNCAETFRAPVPHEKCPACGVPFDPSRFLRLLYWGRNAFEFGYQYRTVFEADYKEARACNARYQLDSVSDIAAFAAVAALSGIIGNASYDLLKVVFRKIRRAARRLPAAEYTVLDEVLATEAGRKKFLEYIHDYARGFVRQRNRQVKAAIEEEIAAHCFVNERHGTDPSKALGFLQTPSPAAVENLWAEVGPGAVRKGARRSRKSGAGKQRRKRR